MRPIEPATAGRATVEQSHPVVGACRHQDEIPGGSVVGGLGKARWTGAAAGDVDYLAVKRSAEEPTVAEPLGRTVADRGQGTAFEQRVETGWIGRREGAPWLERARQARQPRGIDEPGAGRQTHEVSGKAFAVPGDRPQRQPVELTGGTSRHRRSAASSASRRPPGRHHHHRHPASSRNRPPGRTRQRCPAPGRRPVADERSPRMD